MSVSTITYLLFIACSQPEIRNDSLGAWNETDKKELDKAIKVCLTTKEYVNTPCLKSFHKEESGKYKSTCGIEESRKW